MKYSPAKIIARNKLFSQAVHNRYTTFRFRQQPKRPVILTSHFVAS